MKTWRDVEELADRAALLRLIDEHGTAPRIARHLGCSVNNVRGAMKFYGLQPKNWRPKRKMRERLSL